MRRKWVGDGRFYRSVKFFIVPVRATSCDTLSLPSLCTATLNTIQQRATKILAML